MAASADGAAHGARGGAGGSCWREGVECVTARRQLRLFPRAAVVAIEGANLHDVHVSELADYLLHNAHTAEVHLGANEITDGGVEVLAASLPTCAVRLLSLRSNLLEDGSALAISDALARGFAPSSVDLSNNLIGPAGAIAIVRAAWRRDRRTPSSVTLNLSANQIDDAAVGAIADLAARELDCGDRGDSGVDLDGGGAGHSQLAVGDNNLSAAAVARAAALLAAVSIHLVA